MHAIQTQTPLINLAFTDWNGTRRAELEGVHENATVGETLAEAVRALGLPLRTFYHAYLGGRQLSQAETLREAGIRTDDDLRIAPEVSAG